MRIHQPLRTILAAGTLALAAAAPAAGATCPAGVFPAVSTAANSTDPQSALTGDFVTPILDATALQKYMNPLPNPLDPSFVYQPSGMIAGENWYSVSERQITQSIGLVYRNPNDPADPNNGCTAPPAKFWVYGDARDNEVGSAPSASHTYPSPTFEVRANTPTRVTWTNELPATPIVKVDPTLDCGPMAPDCWPYNRTVPHVHGAHVADDSDGHPDAWFTPGFALTGHNWSPNTRYGPTGTYRYENTQEAGTLWYHDHAMGLTHQNAYVGLAGFYLVRDTNETALQAPSGADPALLPRFPYEVPIVLQDRVIDLNGQPITPNAPLLDQNATLVNVPCDPSAGAVAPYACTGTNAILPAGTPCDPGAGQGVSYACPTVPFRTDPARPGSLVPDPAGTLTAPSITPEFFGNIMLVNGQAYPKLDVERRVYRVRLLNGSDSRTYVLRLVDGTTKLPMAGVTIWQIGTEQGFLNAPVQPTVKDPTIVSTVPCAAGSPVGLVCYGAASTPSNAMVLMPGERVDLLIDFKQVPAGVTTVILQNLGPDAPYTGEFPPTPDQVAGGVLYPGNGQVPTVLVPEIMAFNLTVPLNAAVADTLDPSLIGTGGHRSLRQQAIAPLLESVSAASTPKKLYLQERMGPFGRFMLTINGKDYMQALNELTQLGDTETWELYNITPDGHPMHLHLVAFQVVNRQGLLAATGGVANVPATAYLPPDVRPPVNTAPFPDTSTFLLDPAGITPPEANELNAWKDTIFVPPGSVTRIRARFDIPGLYVYHCHILSHEENDMMRPYAVVTPATAVSLTPSVGELTQPAGGGTPVTFTAEAATEIAAYPTTNAFEYRFTVTAPGGAVSDLDNLVAMVPGTEPGYSLVRSATWNLPAAPGNYLVTVYAKGMGPVTPANPVQTASLVYTVTEAAAAVAGISSSTTAGLYSVGDRVDVNISFTRAVSSIDGLTITLNNGAVISTGPLAGVASVSGSFTVAAGQDTPHGATLSVASVTGTVTDGGGNTVTSLRVPPGGNIEDSTAIVIDTVPRVISFMAGGGGAVTGAAVQKALPGKDCSVVAALPYDGYHFVNWTDETSAVVSTVKELTLSNVTATHNITANFAIDSYTVKFSAGANGSVSGTASQTVSHNSSCSTVSAVAASGYHFLNWTDETSAVVGSTKDLTMSNVTGTKTVTANFQQVDGILNPASGKSKADITDALSCLKKAMGITPTLAADLVRGDIAPLDVGGKPLGDGNINVADALMILKIAVGLPLQ